MENFGLKCFDFWKIPIKRNDVHLVRRPFWLWGVCIDAFLYKKSLEERKEDHWSYIFLHISIRTTPYLTKIRKWTIIGRKVALQVIRFDCGMKEAKHRPVCKRNRVGCYYWVKKITVLNSYWTRKWFVKIL